MEEGVAMTVRTAAVAIAAVLACAFGAGTALAHDNHGDRGNHGKPSSSCNLGNGVKHVIYVQFDNTHLFRDRPQFASDLEQMPHLLNFMRQQGTLDDNDHTILISHTAGGIVSSFTGLYPDRNGLNVTNSYRYFKDDGTTTSASAFKYWTDLVDSDNTPPLDALPNMVNGDSGQPKTTPAPWVPYTRAGCDFGGVGTANLVLENTSTGPNGDMTKVFGPGSTESAEAAASNAAPAGTAARALAQTDFVGFAIHCGKGGGVCAGNPNAKADALPDEPGGYQGFQGLFGAKYVNPAITGGQPVVKDTAGQPIADPFGQPGFPGFDGMLANVSLGYIAQMQEAGVPVTFAYVSDAHDNHTLLRASGPGEADYKAQLKSYDDAFGTFFDRLQKDGINKSNTLFVFTVDENDHFAGGDSTDGTWSHTYCNVTAGQLCPSNQIGEVNANLAALLPGAPPFTVHSDSAPTVYVTGNPARTDPAVRQFERDAAAKQQLDPYADPNNPTPLTKFLADPVEEKTLHMVNADPRRTPTFTLFANPDYFLSTFNVNCPDAAHSVPVCIDYHFAWSHGDATEDIGRTWLGFVGPGVRNLGQTSRIWSDHTDVQPTMLSLLGLRTSYEPDGRVLTQALSSGNKHHGATLVVLGDVYKQITAPFGRFAGDTLAASTRALASGSATDDSRYTAVEGRIQALTQRRDALAAQMRTLLTNAAFGAGHGRFDERRARALIVQGIVLLARGRALAAHA
jgi:hypothetical protein